MNNKNYYSKLLILIIYILNKKNIMIYILKINK